MHPASRADLPVSGVPGTLTPYSPAKLAKRWGCSQSHIYNLLNSRALPGFRLGKLWRVAAVAVEEYECRNHMSSASSPEPAQTANDTGPSASSGTRQMVASVTRLARLTG
ncbi:DNA-binding protein [Novosphingobium sp. LASN5T]|nr:DNA-binding protein [Novosphingobium sp. LASN5T]